MKYRPEQCPQCKFMFRILIGYINQAYCKVTDEKLNTDTNEPCPQFQPKERKGEE